VIDRFARLRHDAVIRGDDEDDHVSDLRTTSAHQRERFVAGRVEEDDAAAVADVNVICTDVLRDAAGFALGDLGFANRVKQRRLAVIDVTHDRDDRGASAHVFRTRFVALGGDEFFLEAPHLNLGAELARDVFRRFDVDRAVDGHHHALHQQLGEHVLDADIELVGEILHRHAFGQRDRAGDRRRRRRRRLGARRRRTLASGLSGPRLTAHRSLLTERRTLLSEGRTLTGRGGHARARLTWLLRAYWLRRQRTRTTEHAGRRRTWRRIRLPHLSGRSGTTRTGARFCARRRWLRGGARRLRRGRLNHARLRDLWTFRRRQRARRLRNPPRFFNAQTNRRWHESTRGLSRRRLRLRGGHGRNFRRRFLNRGWFLRRCRRNRRWLLDDFRGSGDRLNGLWFRRRRLLYDDRRWRFDDRLRRGRRWRRWRRRWRYRLRRPGDGCGGSRLDGLDEARRTQHWRGRLRRLGLLRRRSLFRAAALGWSRVLSEHVAAR
jgi:hypothetical protein